MLHFEGDKQFALPQADVFEKLVDARFLVGCIPGAEDVTRAEPMLAEFQLRPGFSFVRGTLKITLQIVAQTAHSARIEVVGKGVGSGSKVVAGFLCTPKGEGAHVHWHADVTELTGLLKAIPRGLVQASAQKVIADIWQSVEAKLVSVS